MVSPLLYLFFLLLAAVRATANRFPTESLLLPITKDLTTNQYYATLHLGTPVTSFPMNLVLDLGGKLTWVDTGGSYNSSSTTLTTVACGTPACKAAVNTGCFIGCKRRTCLYAQYNPFNHLVLRGPLCLDRVSLQASDGFKILTRVSARRFAFVCAGEEQAHKLAPFTTGVLGLARDQLSFPNQVACAFHIPKKFALCLPSSRCHNDRRFSHGAFFIGGARYRLPPYPNGLGFRHTPLIVNPVNTRPVHKPGSSDDYFIFVEAIYVDYTRVSFNEKLLSIDENGVGGTMLSTLQTYTTLHSDIYHAVGRQFLRIARRMGIVQVPPMPPFRYCFASTSIRRFNTGPRVPQISMIVPGGRSNLHWRLYGANSMVDINDEVMCLAFLDGGKRPRSSIVIGTYQMEDYLLEFDLTKKTLGISTSLLPKNTSCTDFIVSI